MKKIRNKTSDAIAALQEEVSEIAKITTQNRMALDMLLASQGGVCTVINTSCCVYVDQSGRISTDLNEIWKQTEILHGVQKDDTSFGFEETWKWLTSWFPDVSSWVKKCLTILGMVLVVFVCVYVVIQCISKCYTKLIWERF